MKKLLAVTASIVLVTSLALAQSGSGVNKDALNPQPEPPGVHKKTTKKKAASRQVQLNPQPEPPGQTSTEMRKAGGDPKSKVELNPQPLPPRQTSTEMRKAGGDPKSQQVELNPQPLPPGARKAGENPAEQKAKKTSTPK